MRKGWKTRIDEREYFEEKKRMREEKSAIYHLMKSQIEYDLRIRLLKERERNETH